MTEEFTDTEFISAYNRIKEAVTDGIIPDELGKSAIILGGQPGAGKSSFYQNRDDLMNFVAINGDEYRRYHPQIKEIVKDDPEHYAERTQSFSNAVVEKLINDLGKEGYGLIIEGTLRNPNVPIKTGMFLKNNDYRVDLVVIACNAEESWKSTLLRAQAQKKAGLIPRLVPIDIYNRTIHSIPESLKKIEKSKLFDSIQIQTRSGDIVFDSEKGDKEAYLENITDIAGWDRNFLKYEQEFIQAKIEILEERLKGIKHDRTDD